MTAVWKCVINLNQIFAFSFGSQEKVEKPTGQVFQGIKEVAQWFWK